MSTPRFKPLCVTGRAGERERTSKVFLPRAFVDRYMNEIRCLKDVARRAKGSEGPDDAEGDVELDIGEAGFVRDDYEPCADTWKAANGKDLDSTGCEQTGLFVALCRHQITEWLIEMVRSGELCVSSSPLSRFFF